MSRTIMLHNIRWLFVFIKLYGSEIPDKVNAIACSLIANASGTVKVKITVLITPEEVDQAVKKTMDWRPPGR